MKDYLTLNHTKWDCKYPVVFIPKRRKKRIYGHLRKELGKMFHTLAQQKECKIVEGRLQADHVRMCIQIPPKFAVSSVIGFIKGKTAITIARDLMGRKKNFTDENFWARGYFVTTVGLEEEMVREYIRKQEEEEERQDQLKLNL